MEEYSTWCVCQSIVESCLLLVECWSVVGGADLMPAPETTAPVLRTSYREGGGGGGGGRREEE